MRLRRQAGIICGILLAAVLVALGILMLTGKL